LSDHALRDFVGEAVFLESEPLDVRVGGDALGFGGGANLFDLRWERGTFSWVAMQQLI
jgi:hypothetical protein